MYVNLEQTTPKVTDNPANQRGAVNNEKKKKQAGEEKHNKALKHNMVTLIIHTQI